jgi:GT2 family glycosyltransferase
MRVLAHIHTLNDADIIDSTIEAVLRQTHPVDAILVVDNGSTDGTLERPSIKLATVLRHKKNLGTSGAVASGLQFALDHDYDWIWVFDADSAPEPDALAKLLDLYTSFAPSLQEEVGFLACLHYNVQDGQPQHGGLFTRHGLANGQPVAETRHYLCHFVIWSGCLYRLAAVRQIGLPNPDYVLDWGEYEYAYRVMKAGYKGFIHQDAVLHHNIRGYTSTTSVRVTLGPATLRFRESAPIRCYYTCRNRLYFVLYDTSLARPWLVLRTLVGVVMLMANFLLRPRNHGAQIRACLRGLWHGVTGNIAARY